MHDAFTIGIPVLAILFGILFNRQGLSDLKSELKAEFQALEARVNARIDAVEGRLNARILSLEARLEERITTLEARLEGRMSALERDYRDFYRTQTQQEMRLDALEKR